jgi:hypothetical protein
MADNISMIEDLRRRAEAAQRAERARAGEGTFADSSEEDSTAEPEVNTAAFGYYRGVRERALHIEFQKQTGVSVSPGYAWLPRVNWQPSGKGRGQTIVLEYVMGLKVTVRGRNLRSLLERIVRHQVFRVTEMGEEADRFIPENGSVVYAIEFDEPDSDSP